MATVLCADDSPTIQKVVELTFADSGIHVICVSDGEAAIRRSRELKPEVLLLDVAMPARNGYEVCEWVRREAGIPQPRVLLLSSALEVYDERRAHACGADGHLAKPFESQALLQRVRSLIEPHAPAGSPPVQPLASDFTFDPFPRAEGLSPSARPHQTRPERPPPASPSLKEPLPGGSSGSKPAGAPASEPAASHVAAAGGSARLSPADIEAIVRRLVDLIGPEVIREIAWEIVPDLADTILREKLTQLAPPKGRPR